MNAIYEVAEAPLYSERLAEFLRQGWEPFAVITGSPPGQNDRIVLRRVSDTAEEPRRA